MKLILIIVKIKSESDVVKIIESQKNYADAIDQITYTTGFAKRLDYCMCLMNVGLENSKRLNIESLSRWMGYESSNTIKQYYTSTTEPDFEFEKSIAEKLGVNIKWLQTGIGEVFKSELPNNNRAFHILEQDSVQQVEEIFFLCSERNTLIIVEKFDDYKYLYIPHEFVFNSCVGRDGASELYSLYYTLKELCKKNLNINQGIYRVTDKDFYEVLHGKKHSIACRHFKDYTNFIMEDFLDLYKTEQQREYYCKNYGEDFIKIQDIVRYMIK